MRRRTRQGMFNSRILTPEVVKVVLGKLTERIRKHLPTLEDEKHRLSKRTRALRKEIANLTDYTASGGSADDVREGLQTRKASPEKARVKLREVTSLLTNDYATRRVLDVDAVRAKLSDVKDLLQRHTDKMEMARKVLAALVCGKIVMKARRRGRRRFYVADFWGDSLAVIKKTGELSPATREFSLVSNSATGIRTPV